MMPDREKVLVGLTGLQLWLKGQLMLIPGHEDLQNALTVCTDALALLKEQEAVEPFHRCIGKEFILIEDSHFDYCPYCGKPITWAKQEGR